VASRPAAAALRERLAAGVPIEVGVVLHWFPHVSAAVVALSHPIHVGDTIHVRGLSTDFVQQVGSLALDGAPVREGTPPQELGVRLAARARPGDRVYRVSW
jgi:putative protease